MGSVLALDEHLDHRLEDELDEIAGFLNAQHARLIDVTARLLAHPGTWQVPGIHTIEHYLCWRTGISATQTPGAPPPPITGNYQHPLGERLDMKWVSFGTPPEHRQAPANHDPRWPADIAWP